MDAATIIKEQVSAPMLASSVWFMMACFMVFLAMLGLCFIDVGFVRRKNVLDTWVQKFVAMASAGVGFAFIGYPLWIWQYNQAFGVENALAKAFGDWWLGGIFVSKPASQIPWNVLPEADIMQIFFSFWFTYVVACAVLLQGAFLERIKALPLAILSFFTAAIIQPFLGYLLWGSTSPITNNGFHEFIGITSGYIVIGCFSLAVNFFLKPRIGVFEEHPSKAAPIPHNFGYVGVGVILLMTAIPFIAIGSGFILPDVGYFGITMTTSGIGMVTINVCCAMAGGLLSGVIIAYRRKEAIWALISPIAGFMINAPMLDIEHAWHAMAWGVFGPPLVVVGYNLVRKMGVDDPKVAPLTILPGLAGSFLHGFVYWGTPLGGFFGLKGEYAFQGAQITPLWQFIGDATCVGVSVVSGLILGFILQKTIGLRVSEQTEIIGADQVNWGMDAYGEEHADVLNYSKN